jgi:hypothetical protein
MSLCEDRVKREIEGFQLWSAAIDCAFLSDFRALFSAGG